jgi:tryptophan synthase alpha chain
MTRIEKTFARLKSEGRKAFIPYITAGDPNLGITLDLVLSLEKAGADIIELGVPFSDPIADGPVIQRATERALKNGVNLHEVLELGENIR